MTHAHLGARGVTPVAEARMVHAIEPDIVMFRGAAYEAIATAFIDGKDVFLIDALASVDDASWMQQELDRRGLSVQAILVTHYMTDHMAGLPMFPGAKVIAHQNYIFTYMLRGHSAEDDKFFIAPDFIVDREFELRWGRHRLRAFHNPGKTMCSMNVDVPDADLAFTADNVLGNIVYISSSAPEMINASIDRLKLLNRGRLVSGHRGVFGRAALDRAHNYLRNLACTVRQIRRTTTQTAFAESIAAIEIERCIDDAVPSAFDREWHQRNLQQINERNLFSLSTRTPKVVSVSSGFLLRAPRAVPDHHCDDANRPPG